MYMFTMCIERYIIYTNVDSQIQTRYFGLALTTILTREGEEGIIGYLYNYVYIYNIITKT